MTEQTINVTIGEDTINVTLEAGMATPVYYVAEDQEFKFDGHVVKIKIPPQTHLDGLMRGWADYFKDSW